MSNGLSTGGSSPGPLPFKAHDQKSSRNSVAIVGGAGFVGHNLGIHLPGRVGILDHWSVNNINSLPAGDPYNAFIDDRVRLLDGHENMSHWCIDAREYTRTSPALAEFNPDVIVHLAAVAHIDRANKDPRSTFDHSLQTLENSLDIARNLNCGLVYFSSSTVYGDFSQAVIDEDEPLKPFGIYGNLKAAGELMCRAYHQAYGLPIVVIRPQALYGPRCISGRVTQAFIERARQGLPIQIHGDGTEKHDFTCIYDLISAMKRVLALDFGQSFMRTWNIAAGKATAMDRLAQIVSDRYPVAIEHIAKDDGKPRRGTMSCAAIRSELGWRPEWGIEAGMKNYMDWYDRTLGPGQTDSSGDRSTAA